MVNCFIEHGCDVNATIDDLEYTALHLAAKIGLNLFDKLVK